jgi:hypothetical protein
MTINKPAPPSKWPGEEILDPELAGVLVEEAGMAPAEVEAEEVPAAADWAADRTELAVFEADERAEAEVEAAGAVLEERPREKKPRYKKIFIAISNSIPYRSGPSRGGCIEEWEKKGRAYRCYLRSWYSKPRSR